MQKTRWAKGVLVDSWQDTEQLKLVLLPMSWSALQKKIRHIVDWSPNNRVAVYIFYHIILIYTLQICLNFTFQSCNPYCMIKLDRTEKTKP